MAKTGTVTRYTASVAIVVAITTVYRLLFHVNPTTVALTFLLLILFVSAYWEFRLAALTSLLATAAFNFFFLPPYGTFTIADPQNWIALFVFLITAIVASNLAERARREAAQARQRRTEVERLYALSQSLLTAENTLSLLNRIPGMVTDTFGTEGAMLRITSRDTTYNSHPNIALDSGKLRATIARGEPTLEVRAAYIPLRIGIRTTGALALAGTPPSRETLDAISSLIGIAIERANAVEELTRTRALQENEKLRSALLDSVTHEFRTPLTGIKASVTTLLAQYNLDEDQRQELLTVIEEETDRLNRLVGEAAEMSQLDSGMFKLEKHPHSLRQAVDAAFQEMKTAVQPHPITISIADDLPLVLMDCERIAEVLVHLVQNAAKYSPPESPIQINANVEGDCLVCSVADHGPGIDSFEQSLIFDKFYRGRNQRYAAHGTGMGLAICKTIIEAHGGTIAVVSQVGSGSVFSFSLPLNESK
jgi:two-component system, OmpR family, sensor histidine kinase KdpD